MVLFVFVIMLLNLKEEELRRLKMVTATLGVVAVGVIAMAMITTIRQSRVGFTLQHTMAEGSTVALGKNLFVNAALPFEVISLLLLVAMIGTILLSKKDLR
jgi:NADH-quinone oxidoreductase subunit J